MQTENREIILVAAQSVEEVQEAVRAHRRVLVRGGGSKPALSSPGGDETALVEMSALSGVQVYDPGEFTFTALAGTPVREVDAMLAEKGQYLPFDPPFAGQGATLGGAVAAGTSGSRRYRYGGVRDFLIGIRFVDGRGEVVRGGGNVVKNAAGFDFPKLMVGSLGRLGLLTELTFKVFPAPQATASLHATYTTLDLATDALVRLTRSKFDLEALDLAPGEDGVDLWVRLGGISTTLDDRLQRLTQLLQAEQPPQRIESLRQEETIRHWEEMGRVSWRPAGSALVKVPVTPKRIRELDGEWASQGVARRYSSGGNTAWLGWPAQPDAIHVSLRRHGLAGLLLDGPAGRPWLGEMKGRVFMQRIAATLDPEDKFGALSIWPAN
jgi:glycolate oxidase FAD binding subunit